MNLADWIGGTFIVALYCVAVLAAVTSVYMAIFKKGVLFIGVVAILVFFNSQTSGAIGEDANTIYFRGSGLLFLSALNWVMIVGFVGSIVQLEGHRRSRGLPNSTVGSLYWAIFALCVGHFLVGLYSEIPVQILFSNNGLFPLFLSSMFFLWGSSEISRGLNLRKYFDLLVAAIFLRCIFGVCRFLAFGGDPVNIYENIEKLGVRVVFFDFHDSTIATLMIAYSLSMLLLRQAGNRRSQFFFVSAICVGLFVVIFSHHRASIFGLLLAGGTLLPFLSLSQRWLFSIALGVAVAGGATAITYFRLSKVGGMGGVTSQLFYDLLSRSQVGANQARFLEQKSAFETFLENPIFGTGSWGKYQGFGIGWQDLAGARAYETVHNGFLQFAFKAGLIGVGLVVALFVAHVLGSIAILRKTSGWHRCASIASVGAFLSMLPNFSVGMVAAQQRGLILMSFLIFLPYAILATYAKDSAALAESKVRKYSAFRSKRFTS